MPSFERVSGLFTARRGRRRLMRDGLAAGVATAAAVRFGPALARDTTPVALPDEERTMFLFVQAFEQGTWAPKSGEEGVYTLTLSGGLASTVYFSDRPERVFGMSPTGLFLENLGFTPTNPPNAAIVVSDDGTADILIIELTNPVYAADAGTLTYDVKVLEGYTDEGLAYVAAQHADAELPASFGCGALFIDDCPNGTLDVWFPDGTRTSIANIVPCCYSYPSCDVCGRNWDAYVGEHYESQCGADNVMNCIWQESCSNL